MKRIILSVAFTLIAIGISAQTINAHLKNGQTIQYNSNNMEYVDFSLKASESTLTEGQVVDLGLSVYWASCNLGANNPEDYGGYYCWGETMPKNGSYHSEDYEYYNKDTKEFIFIGRDISGTEYDAATVNLGSDWRLPTLAEMQELINNCTWEWNHVGSTYGFVVTGKNGNSIFLPAGGSKAGIFSISLGDKAFYWTSQEYSSESACSLEATNAPKISYLQKWAGQSIRPVTSNPNAIITEPNLYKLTYMLDNEVYKTYELKSGEIITPEPAPTKEGYTFSGWSEIPEKMPNHDVTVTGTFTINKYKLIYKVDGEEYKSYEVEYGATITPEAEPTKEGYTFSGWSYIPTKMPAEDVTVTGSFTVNKYKLTYIVDGEEYKSYEIEYGVAITPEPAPTKDGYTFSGWSERKWRGMKREWQGNKPHKSHRRTTVQSTRQAALRAWHVAKEGRPT